jgi:hypothetical protein
MYFILIVFIVQVRLKAQEKKVDHMERAKRLEEIPLLKEQHEDLKAERKQVKIRFFFVFKGFGGMLPPGFRIRIDLMRIRIRIRIQNFF